MPKGWLYDWEGMATMGRQNPETRSVESLLVLCLCVSSLSLIDAQKTFPAPHKGLVTNWTHHNVLAYHTKLRSSQLIMRPPQKSHRRVGTKAESAHPRNLQTRCPGGA
jgi:hypothetical protein